MTWEEATEDFRDQSRIASRSLGYGYKAVLNQDEDLVIVRCDIGGIGNGRIDLDEEIRVVNESEFGSGIETSITDWEVL